MNAKIHSSKSEFIQGKVQLLKNINIKLWTLFTWERLNLSCDGPNPVRGGLQKFYDVACN